jgi:DNA-binding NtrC family response regulator
VTRILVIDDQQETLDLLKALFRAEGYEVDVVRDGTSAQEHLESAPYDVVFTDLRLGYPYDGIEILTLVKSIRPKTQVVIMTAFGSVESSVLASKGGAYDYICKPFNREEVLLLAARASEKAQLTARVENLEERVERSRRKQGRGLATEIVGSSPEMVSLMRLVGKVARTEATVLVLGESGTGKELVAQAIHELSPRHDKPFVPVNCGAIPENLQESEFFGHAKGAFTGAIRTKQGLFQRAHGGTLFLDEVGETSLTTQVKLLRFLQSGEVRKVGDSQATHVDVRLVTATNRDLLAMVEQKLFREDLYYRLNIISLEAPPLRERRGDVRLLSEYFLGRYVRKLRNGVRGFTPEAMAVLEAYHWPGNVRELENAVERAVTLARSTLLRVEDLPRLERRPRPDQIVSASLPSLPPLGSGRPSAIAPGPGPVAHPALPLDPRPSRYGGQHGPGPAAGRRPEEYNSPSRAFTIDSFPTLRQLEREHIERALELFGGNRTRACGALGISKATLWRKLKSYQEIGNDQVAGETSL